MKQATHLKTNKTKFVEIRHDVFLKDEMVKGSKVLREVDLQEKRTYVPISMFKEPYFSIHAEVPPIVILCSLALLSWLCRLVQKIVIVLHLVRHHYMSPITY
jgi:hypothetical protein